MDLNGLKPIARSPYVFPGAVFVTVIMWFLLHFPILNYGTEPLPIHAAYVGDEQGPINGALHILEERSLLALRDAHNTQYGPLISLLAVAPALADFAVHIAKTGTLDSESYKNAVIWDWTGILFFGRMMALAAGATAVMAVFLIVRRFSSTAAGLWPAAGGALLLAANWHFFEYSTYYRHWVFVSAVLLWQIYFLLRLRQEDGRRLFAWIMLAVLPVLSFGISYFGIFFQVMWLPVIIDWYHRRRFDLLKKFFYHGLVVVAGCALIIAWVPGPFYRAVGIGYGDISGQGVEEYVNEDFGSNLSFSYYITVVGINNLALLLALALMLIVLYRQRVYFDRVMVGSVAFTAASYFIFFALQSHHEPRYILPTIVLLVLLTGAIFAILESRVWPQDKRWRTIVIGLLIFQIAFHAVHIVRASYVFHQGAPEQATIKKLLPIIATDPSLKILAYRDNPFGYPHTRRSYSHYAERFGFSDRGLFLTLETTAVYPNETLFDIDYFSYFHLPADEAPRPGDYDIVISRHRPNEPDVPNDRDQIDVNLMNWWYPTIDRDQFRLICVSTKCFDYESSF